MSDAPTTPSKPQPAPSNLSRYEADLDRLIDATEKLKISMQREVARRDVDDQLKAVFGEKADAFIKALPKFSEAYQAWFSEALVVIRSILPDRLADFRSHYDRPRAVRKSIDWGNYVLEDFIQGLRVTRGHDVVVDKSAAVPRFDAQIAILKACKSRFRSSLFDMRQLVQADVLDSELSGAKELLKNGFLRASGVIAGVVLERHLQEVVAAHEVKVKPRPTLGDFIQALKDAEVVGTPDWRRLQHLNELRVKCTHNKGLEPTKEDVSDLISGVERTIKNLF